MTKEFLERVFLPFERETRKKEMKEEIIEEKKIRRYRFMWEKNITCRR